MHKFEPEAGADLNTRRFLFILSLIAQTRGFLFKKEVEQQFAYYVEAATKQGLL